MCREVREGELGRRGLALGEESGTRHLKKKEAQTTKSGGENSERKRRDDGSVPPKRE